MRRLFTAFGLAVGASLACSSTTSAPSGLFVVVSAPDVYGGADFDTLQFTVQGKTVQKPVSALPTSVSIVGTPNTEVKVDVRALLHGVVRFATYAKTTVPSGRFALVKVAFAGACQDRCVQVAPDQPITAYCDPKTLDCVHEAREGVDVSTLPTYDPASDPTAGLGAVDCGGGSALDGQACNGTDFGALQCSDVSGESSTGDLSCVACRGVASATCTNANGLAATAIWPTVGGSPLRQNRTTIVGPKSAPFGPTPLAPPIGGVLSAPVIDASDTLWFTSSGLTAPAIDFTKRAGVVVAVQKNTVTRVFQPDPEADCLLDLSVQGNGSSGCRLGAPVIADDGFVYTTANTLATFQIVGKGPGQQFSVVNLGVGCKGQSSCNSIQSASYFRNDASAGRLAYFPTGAGLFIFKVTAGGQALSNFNNPFGYSSDCVTWGGTQVAVDKTGTTYIPVNHIFNTKDKPGLCAVDAHGLLKWHSPITDGGILTTPAIGSDGIVYFGGTDQTIHAIDIKKPSAFKWALVTSGATTAPAIGVDGTIYFGTSDEKVHAVDPEAKEKWVFDTQGAIVATPLIDGDGTIYVGSTRGLLYAINPNGSLLWRSILGSPVSQSGAITSDGTLYQGTDDGFVFAFPAVK